MIDPQNSTGVPFRVLTRNFQSEGRLVIVHYYFCKHSCCWESRYRTGTSRTVSIPFSFWVMNEWCVRAICHLVCTIRSRLDEETLCSKKLVTVLPLAVPHHSINTVLFLDKLLVCTVVVKVMINLLFSQSKIICIELYAIGSNLWLCVGGSLKQSTNVVAPKQWWLVLFMCSNAKTEELARIFKRRICLTLHEIVWKNSSVCFDFMVLLRSLFVKKWRKAPFGLGRLAGSFRL